MRTCLCILAFAIATLAHPSAMARSGEDGAAVEPDAPLTEADIPTRIADAEVGEWVLYRLASGKYSRLTVREKWKDRKDTHLVIVNETLDAKRKPQRMAEEEVTVSEAVADMRNLGPEDRLSRREILVRGRTIETVVVDYVEDGVLVRQSYFSDKVPVHGLVRGISHKGSKKSILNLVDYGFAGDGEEDED